MSIAATNSGPARVVRLGGSVDRDERPQLIVPADHWQSAEPAPGAEAPFELRRQQFQRYSVEIFLSKTSSPPSMLKTP